MFAYVGDTNAWVDVLGLEGSIYANARKMTDKEISRFFGDEKWHKTNAKRDYLDIFQKVYFVVVAYSYFILSFVKFFKKNGVI